eukprot:TRINITY_DN31297_c0_g1_i1.p1 TRINITY_DN31297_c0_g1~~TRINITY_DN31297_c0_g1_i1.p1  ORF type:complete len:284 (-),score=41.42 TRINITY_DN31297_c0_g1_i1:63-878(-)
MRVLRVLKSTSRLTEELVGTRLTGSALRSPFPATCFGSPRSFTTCTSGPADFRTETQSNASFRLLYSGLPYSSSNHFSISRAKVQMPQNILFSRSFHQSSSLLKKSKEEDIAGDTLVVFIDAKNKEHSMKYQELLEKIGERNLVRVKRTKRKDDIPHFKIMSDVDLEIALRKQKNETKYMGSREIIETDDGRIKQKTLEIKSKISEHDFRIQIEKVRKWLAKGDFVKVVIKCKAKSEGESMEKSILEAFEDRQDLLGVSNAKLKFNIRSSS